LTEQHQLDPTRQPLPEASDGDLAEQQQVAVPDLDSDDEVTSPSVPLEADPADAVEQQQPVPDPDEDYAQP